MMELFDKILSNISQVCVDRLSDCQGSELSGSLYCLQIFSSGLDLTWKSATS